MRHALRLVATYFRLGALNELQYRSNFWVNLLQSILSLVTALGGLAIVFDHTDTLAGWTPMDLVALLGIFFLMRGLINTVVQPSMQRFLEDVRLGTLDFVLTKPVDAQLLVSIRRVAIWNLIDFGVGLALIVYASLHTATQIGPGQLVAFVLTLAAGAVIVYSFWLMLATLAFWFIRIENILVIFQSMYQAGRWPITIYPQYLRIMLTFLVPVAFAVTVPAEALVGRASQQTVLLAVAMALGFFVVARGFWRFGVRHYSGASA